MAEQERKTKAERRAEARAARKRAEEEAAKAAKKAQIRNGIVSVVVVGAIALVLIPTFSRVFGGGANAAETVVRADMPAARQAAGCTMDVNGDTLPDSVHHDASSAPPGDVLYAQSPVRPTASGPHFGQQNGIISGVPSAPLEERALTHNLEHGAAVVYFDADAIDDATVDAMESWMQARLDNGFTGQGAAAVFVTSYEGFAGVSADKPIAMRAWGFALNCESWDQDVADSFLIDYWGTHGQAPERNFAEYPTEALGYLEDQDSTEEPADVEPTDEGDTGEPADEGAATDEDTEPAGDASEG